LTLLVPATGFEPVTP